MSAVPDTIKAAIDLANDSYIAGYCEGREIGFNEGLQAAQELIGGKAPEQIILERRLKLSKNAAGHLPECEPPDEVGARGSCVCPDR